jgi:hypothetical protein
VVAVALVIWHRVREVRRQRGLERADTEA